MKYRIFSEDFVYVALNVKGYGTDLLKFPSDVFSKFPKNSVTGMVEIEEVKKVCSKIWVDKCGIISYDEALKNSEVIISPMITEVYDEIIAVSNEASFEYSKIIAKEEGVLVGISSGAALYAAIEVAKRPEFEGKTVVALLPDSGDRYYSTDLFKD